MARAENTIALVTGGAGGIGQATARRFIEEGARVALADIDPRGAAVAGDLGAFFVELDVASEDSWAAAVASVVDRWGPVSVLVNNAGITGRTPLLETTPAAFRRVVDVIQLGTFLGMRAVAPAMRAAGRGAIVNVSSVAGLRGAVNAFSYTAAKFAVRGMTQSAAVELGGYGIRVNCVFPGPIRTAMMAGVNDENFADLPLSRMGDPAEVAAVIAFLASDDASFITGAEQVVDGGLTAVLPGPRMLGAR